MRKIQAIGNVTRDAEVRHLEGGRSVINFDIACSERWTDKSGTKQTKTYYIKCVMWRDSTTIAQYILKGVKLYLSGTPEVDTYINKEGKAVGSVKINVQDLEFLSSAKKAEPTAQTTSNNESLVPTPDDDLPF